MEPKTLRTLVHEYLERLSAHDLEGWVALHTSDAIFVDPISDEAIVGHEGLRGFFEQVGGFSTELRATDIQPVLFGPNTAAIRWTARPTLRRSGKEAQWPCVTTFHFNAEGKIRHAIVCWDHRTALADAGVER